MEKITKKTVKSTKDSLPSKIKLISAVAAIELAENNI